MTYTVDQLRERNLIIFESIMGSQAYGTNLPSSDEDIRGVFIQPLDDIFRYGFVEQVADKTNDVVFYELKRFLQLVKTNNPNILELLNAPVDCIKHCDPLFDLITQERDQFITKKCRWTFAGYAIEQIKKARGFNKKMNWEESKMVRKTVLDFCYVLVDGGTMPLKHWMGESNDQSVFSLAAIDHAHDLYGMYITPGGIVSDEDKANDVQLSSIPKDTPLEAYLTFNKDAYSTHCKRYKEYQSWLKNRNEDRVKMNKDHGKNYDSKNMAHCIRLLDMAIEIGTGQGIIVRRPADHRELLLSIRRGEMEFDELIQSAESKIELLDKVFDESGLPPSASDSFISELESKIRNIKYDLNKK
jgi:uncharacterized protein